MRHFVFAAAVICPFAGSASAALVGYWNFNSLTTGTNNGASYAPTSGVGSLNVNVVASDQAGNNRGIIAFGGSTSNALNSDPAGQALAIQGGASEATSPVDGPNASIVLKFDFTSLQNPVLSFATQRTSTGFGGATTPDTIDYSTDGVHYLTFASYSPAASFSTQTFDLSAINVLDGASTAFIRMSLIGATSNAGNNRIDNIQLNASPLTAVPEASPILLGLMICGVVSMAFGGCKLWTKAFAA